MRYAKEKLQEIGFREVAQCRLEGEKLAYDVSANDPEAAAIGRFPNVLYAFTSGETVLYVGKTTKSLRERFIGYCKPGPSQSTNQKRHARIKKLLQQNFSVSISVFSSDRFLRYDIFEINLAAGLEDSLIKILRPRWNGKHAARGPITETAEIEANVAAPDAETESPARTASSKFGKFSVTLGKTYYRGGFINTGRSVSESLGPDGSPLLIHLGGHQHAGVKTKINRRANSNGTPRIYGGQEVAEWFQKNFSLAVTMQQETTNGHQ